MRNTASVTAMAMDRKTEEEEEEEEIEGAMRARCWQVGKTFAFEQQASERASERDLKRPKRAALERTRFEACWLLQVALLCCTTGDSNKPARLS